MLTLFPFCLLFSTIITPARTTGIYNKFVDSIKGVKPSLGTLINFEDTCLTDRESTFQMLIRYLKTNQKIGDKKKKIKSSVCDDQNGRRITYCSSAVLCLNSGDATNRNNGHYVMTKYTCEEKQIKGLTKENDKLINEITNRNNNRMMLPCSILNNDGTEIVFWLMEGFKPNAMFVFDEPTVGKLGDLLKNKFANVLAYVTVRPTPR